MHCPQCNCSTHVLDTRIAYRSGIEIVQRRRECTKVSCRFRFKTTEIADSDWMGSPEEGVLDEEVK